MARESEGTQENEQRVSAMEQKLKDAENTVKTREEQLGAEATALVSDLEKIQAQFTEAKATKKNVTKMKKLEKDVDLWEGRLTRALSEAIDEMLASTAYGLSKLKEQSPEKAQELQAMIEKFSKDLATVRRERKSPDEIDTLQDTVADWMEKTFVVTTEKFLKESSPAEEAPSVPEAAPAPEAKKGFAGAVATKPGENSPARRALRGLMSAPASEPEEPETAPEQKTEQSPLRKSVADARVAIEGMRDFLEDKYEPLILELNGLEEKVSAAEAASADPAETDTLKVVIEEWGSKLNRALRGEAESEASAPAAAAPAEVAAPEVAPSVEDGEGEEKGKKKLADRKVAQRGKRDEKNAASKAVFSTERRDGPPARMPSLAGSPVPYHRRAADTVRPAETKKAEPVKPVETPSTVAAEPSAPEPAPVKAGEAAAKVEKPETETTVEPITLEEAARFIEEARKKFPRGDIKPAHDQRLRDLLFEGAKWRFLLSVKKTDKDTRNKATEIAHAVRDAFISAAQEKRQDQASLLPVARSITEIKIIINALAEVSKKYPALLPAADIRALQHSAHEKGVAEFNQRFKNLLIMAPVDLKEFQEEHGKQSKAKPAENVAPATAPDKAKEPALEIKFSEPLTAELAQAAIEEAARRFPKLDIPKVASAKKELAYKVALGAYWRVALAYADKGQDINSRKIDEQVRTEATRQSKDYLDREENARKAVKRAPTQPAPAASPATTPRVEASPALAPTPAPTSSPRIEAAPVPAPTTPRVEAASVASTAPTKPEPAPVEPTKVEEAKVVAAPVAEQPKRDFKLLSAEKVIVKVILPEEAEKWVLVEASKHFSDATVRAAWANTKTPADRVWLGAYVKAMIDIIINEGFKPQNPEEKKVVNDVAKERADKERKYFEVWEEDQRKAKAGTPTPAPSPAPTSAPRVEAAPVPPITSPTPAPRVPAPASVAPRVEAPLAPAPATPRVEATPTPPPASAAPRAEARPTAPAVPEKKETKTLSERYVEASAQFDNFRRIFFTNDDIGTELKKNFGARLLELQVMLESIFDKLTAENEDILDIMESHLPALKAEAYDLIDTIEKRKNKAAVDAAAPKPPAKGISAKLKGALSGFN